jgi:ABC-type nitrate/sulfonate/bicarbonate transport system substrate-binding protein
MPLNPLDRARCRRRFAAGLAWAALASAWAGSPAAAQPLTIATSRTSLSLPVYVAQAQGFFSAAGVEVRSVECLGGHRCIVEMLQGRAEIATTTELPVAFHAFQRADFAIFASLVNAPGDLKVLVRKSSGIYSVDQLAGKRVAATRTTSAHYYLDSALLFEGVDPRKVELLALAPEQVGPALLAGQADAAVVWEPFANETLRALGDDGRVLPHVRIYSATFNLLALRTVLAGREAQLVAVLRALDRAIRFIHDKPVQAQAILQARLGMDPAYIASTWQDAQFRLVLNQSLVTTLEGQVRWALREGHVPGATVSPVNMLQFIEPAPLAKAVPGAVTLVR